MYVPRSNAMSGTDVQPFVAEVGAAEFITVDVHGQPQATFLPVAWDGDRVVSHFARANPHWESIVDGAPILVVVRGAHGYVRPGWYPTKEQHGQVVPTWNYTEVQIRGRAHLVHDVATLRSIVTHLTDTHERPNADPWSVDEAPPDFIDTMLRGIVGIQVEVTNIQAKAKLSQNRPLEDRIGVIAGFDSTNNQRGEHAVSAAMKRLLPH